MDAHLVGSLGRNARTNVDPASQVHGTVAD
jgi:hypothetical protein